MARALERHPRLLFFLRYWLPVLGYLGMIFALSSQPNLQAPLHFTNADKLIHGSEYMGLGLVLFPLVRASNPARSLVFTALFTLACGMTIAAADENYQRLIPGRQCDILDWAADSTGIAVAQAAMVALARGGR